MQALNITLPGKFWDSHVYSGRLYLFDRHGSIITVNWDELIRTWDLPAELKLAMDCAFARSDYLYGQNWAPMFGDLEIKKLLISKFERLELILSARNAHDWHRAIFSQQDNPLPFPHTDARIYSGKMYVASEAGLSHAGCNKTNVKGISRKAVKDWDCPILSVATYSNSLAMAAGEAGLFEKRIGDTWWEYADDVGGGDVKQIAKNHCGQCEWAFYSVFGSSHEGGGFLASFEVDRMPWESAKSYSAYLSDSEPDSLQESNPPARRSTGIRFASDIFKHKGFSWANREKVYQASQGVIRAIRYMPWNDDGPSRFARLPDIHLSSWKGDVVSAGVAMFGTIVECENCLVVVLSDGSTETIPGEPVRWRVFPRSKHYENQLHVIYEDRMDVWSFNHDYFVDQSSKVFGLEHDERRTERWFRP